MYHLANGPDLFTNIIKDLCKGAEISKKKARKCQNFTILPYFYCFPYDYKEFNNFFNEDLTEEAMTRIEKSYFVHIWNKAQTWTGKSYDTNLTSKSAFVQLTRTYCPRIFDGLESYI
jgi:Alpha 1,4-glycosyltransferase conserved region